MKILVVAGEASADTHAAHVLQLLAKSTDLQLFGIGGAQLRALGLDPIAHAEEMAVVGLTEVISRIPRSLQLITELEARAKQEKPDLAMLIDLPDFNLRLAPKLRKLGIPVVYYVSPQVWAWRSGRVTQMAKCIDHLLCILPFEKSWYERHAPKNLRVSYVGHPMLEEIPELEYCAEPNHIVLLPGSRKRELKNLLPAMLQAAGKLLDRIPELRFTLPLATPLRNDSEVADFLSPTGVNSVLIAELGDSFTITESPSADVLRSARVAVVASGTATLETALIGVPMVVVYKVSPISAFIFRNLVGYSGPIAMANILHVGLESQERVVPELLQTEANADRIAGEVLKLILSEDLWQRQATRLANTRALLSQGISGSPSDAVVQAILEFQC